MKKIRLLLFLFMLIVLTSCMYNGYSGDYSELYTVAINSVLWNNGHSWGADFECDPEIEIIDEDDYGRTMFTYYEKYYGGSDISFSSLIICQNATEKEVFYYEDINFIIKEQIKYTQNLSVFASDEIEQLKVANDWNQKINLDKCIKKEIIKNKPNIPNEKDIENKIIEEFHLIDGQYSLHMDFLTKDSLDSNFIIYGYIRLNVNEGVSFIGIVETEEELLKEINFLVPLNVYDYKIEFIEFKKINNWV